MSFFRMCLVVAFNTKRCQVLIVICKVRSVLKVQYVMNHYRRFQPSVLLAVSAEVFVSAKDLFSFLSPSLLFVEHSCSFRCVKERDTAGADGVSTLTGELIMNISIPYANYIISRRVNANNITNGAIWCNLVQSANLRQFLQCLVKDVQNLPL